MTRSVFSNLSRTVSTAHRGSSYQEYTKDITLSSFWLWIEATRSLNITKISKKQQAKIWLKILKFLRTHFSLFKQNRNLLNRILKWLEIFKTDFKFALQIIPKTDWIIKNTEKRLWSHVKYLFYLWKSTCQQI